MSTNKVLEIQDMLQSSYLAQQIADRFVDWTNKRAPYMANMKETRNFVFATDTSTTTVGENTSHSNSTTIPKLTQIRDNLHANYMSALFPNDNYIRWEAYTKEAAEKEKRDAITAYMSNKLREGNFQQAVSQCLFDYIDGNAFGEAVWVEEKHELADGEIVDGFIGPKLLRTSINDIVFDPSANEFRNTPKITRYLKTLGEIKKDAENRPELNYSKDIINYIEEVRGRTVSYSQEDWDKAAAYQVDGFGSLRDYYASNYAEILEFEGDIHDEQGNFKESYLITVIDRTHVLREEKMPSWFGKDNRVHTGWRKRHDNLYGMGALDNLVGMQYRLDHLENLKADALDQTVWPPLKIVGDVDEFEWGPGAEIDVGDSGDVVPMPPNSAAFQVNNEIMMLMQQMEEMAGAPKEAMGIRTPGEKTAFEVQSLQNAAGRIFQAKVTQFEIEFIEPALNIMLEMAVRNINGKDVIRVMDDDLGFTNFIEITKEDITARGKLRPIGSRHFAASAQLVQNINGVFNSQIGQIVAPHISAIGLAKMVEDALGWEKYQVVKPNVAIMEQGETQRLANSVSDTVEEEAITPTEPEADVAE